MCPRCGYKTDKVFLFKNHINRSKVCAPRLANVSLEQLRTQYCNDNVKELECNLCSKKFGSKSGLYKHKQTCTGVDRNDLVQTMTCQEILKVLQRIETLLMNQRDISLFNQINSPLPAPIIPAIQEVLDASPVKTKDFGQEEILHLLHNQGLMKIVFEQYETGLFKFIDLIWFEDTHAKNKNIKIIDKDTAEYYQYQKWNKIKLNSLLFKITDFVGCYLQQALEHSAFLSESFLNGYMEKIGVHMEWDLSHEEWEYGNDQEEDENVKRKILQGVKLHLMKKIS